MATHVIPAAELFRHTRRVDCWCRPDMVRRRVVHRSLEGATALLADVLEDASVSNTSKPGSGSPTTDNKPSGGSGTRPGGGAGTSPSKPGDPGKR